MKKILSIILLSPIIISLIVLDILKLPLVIAFIMPLTFLFSLSSMLRGNSDWFSDWVRFNSDFACLTYMMRGDLFGL